MFEIEQKILNYFVIDIKEKKILLIFKNFKWQDQGSLNNLKDVYRLYCPLGPEIEKDTRETFIKGSVDDVVNNFQVLTCINNLKINSFNTTNRIFYFQRN